MKKEFIKPIAELMQVETKEQILAISGGDVAGGVDNDGDRARKQNNTTVNPADNTKPQGIEF